MNIIIGGISGLAQTISFSQKQIPQSVRERIDLPEHDACVNDFNCALDGPIILQGNLYLFNTALCFHSLFNKQSIVGNNDTVIFMPFNTIICMEKVKKMLVFDNSIRIKSLAGVFTFTSFVRRNSTFDTIQEYRNAFYNMLPAPIFDFKDDPQQQQQQKQGQFGHLSYQNQERQSKLDSIQNEDDWLALVNTEILKLEIQSQQEQSQQQGNQQQQQQQKSVVSIIHNPPPQLPKVYLPALQQQRIQQQQQQQQQYGEQHEHQDDEQLENPLELQKSSVRDFKANADIYAPLFKERALQIKQQMSNDYNMTDLKEQMIMNMSVREVFSVFFSNVRFQKNDNSPVFNNFMDFYLKEYLHAKNLVISQITPEPPEIFNSIYSSNYSQMLEYHQRSSRVLTFDHPIPNPSFFMPKSLHCSMNETFHWCSPDEFILSRNINLSGAPMCKSFEPRVVFILTQQGANVAMRAGFKVHFKSNSPLKKIIENGARDENDKTWNEMKNAIANIAKDYCEKRDMNRRVEQQVNSESFVRREDVILDPIEEAVPVQVISQSQQVQNNQKNQMAVVAEQQQSIQENYDPQRKQEFEEGLNQLAEKASKQACTIF